MSKFFTKVEAERLLAEVKPVIEDAIRLKAALQEAEIDLHQTRQRIALSGGAQLDRSGFIGMKARRDRSAASLKAAIERIHEFGCVVKDLDIGLIDFPTLLRGREVYLCWRLGEAGIRFWHGVDEGFSGRKPIDADFLDHHRGDEQN
jgi:hypothetical protein